MISRKKMFSIIRTLPLVILSCLDLMVFTAAIDKHIGKNTSQLLDHLLSDYDRRLRPDFGGPPTLVDVNLNIRSMGPITENEMAYQMDCYFRQSWVDKRLEFNASMPTLTVAINLLDRLWKPDTHFMNGQKSYLHTVTSPNKLLRINRDGRILYSMRLTIKATCPMHLHKFPMDTQTCPLKFGSQGYTYKDIEYEWSHGSGSSIKMSPDMRMSMFDLTGYPHDRENVTQVQAIHSTLYVNFKLKRHTGYFLINVYIPCSLLVVISWVAFWINREATGDRIALGVTTVLTMTFLSIDNRTDLPKVSYSTALDIFVASCFAFVLATIVQFAGVHFFTKRGYGEEMHAISDSEEEEDEDLYQNYNNLQTERMVFSQDNRYRYTMDRTNNGDTQLTVLYNDKSSKKYKQKEECCSKFYHCLAGSAEYRQKHLRASPRPVRGEVNSVSKIDMVCRIVFPAVFAVFNVFYWYFYLYYAAEGQFFR